MQLAYVRSKYRVNIRRRSIFYNRLRNSGLVFERDGAVKVNTFLDLTAV